MITLKETTGVISWPNGGYNDETDIKVTTDGIEIMDGYILIPWEWIDSARNVVYSVEKLRSAA